MGYAFFVMMGVAMLMVLVSLFMGVMTMGKDTEEAKLRSQKLMRARVYLQGLAILLFVLAALSK